ncbi:MAG: pilus assembly protein [Nitrincola lacisaponensis]|uniref:pilus assembly protein n=1 Tax=Nitrincola lacisaponensis TaxID=267850 RepID=UPI00391C2F3E
MNKSAFLPLTSYLSLSILIALTSVTSANAQVAIGQKPLLVSEGVPGNLILTPSVEWPTINSVANLGDYDDTRSYAGYFDANKCYKYHYSVTEAERHFYPFSTTSNRRCAGSELWSGNFLNWAATQTIDPFRSALTGGLRVRDTATETWLEKARHDGQGGTGVYPNRRLPASGDSTTAMSRATPFSTYNNMTMRIQGLGNKMRFRLNGTGVDGTATAYNPASAVNTNTIYEVSVRVKVCDPTVSLEPNCVQYSQGWKPEGLLQEYSDKLRYSIFGYLNDSNMLRDGGVLRANQRYIGPQRFDAVNGWVDNPNKEWNTTTGVLIRNPDPDAATATNTRLNLTTQNTILDSGVINYLNKFGQMTTQNHKSHDPVSELYYAATRYIRNVGNVSAYSSITTNDSVTAYRLADGFPVVTSWEDPYQFWCQASAILGIGDANTHRDKNLPGNSRTNDEPAVPSEVSSDDFINVVTATNKVAQLEGITINLPFTGRENSAYIAGLAYDAHTRDQRPDLQGRQTVSTHWVDVRENQHLEPRHRNQYWLAAKYGGFRVPDGYSTYEHNTALPAAWWHTTGDMLGTNYPRTDNFYVASEADKMIESLQDAFANIQDELRGSASALAANTFRLEQGARIYQSEYISERWTGDVIASPVDPDTGAIGLQVWRASEQLPLWSNRIIRTHNPSGNNAAARFPLFQYGNLNGTQQAALNSSTNLVNYIRGNHAHEISNGGTFRNRSSLLGTMINSQPVFVGAPDRQLYVNRSFSGANTHVGYANTRMNRTPVVYVQSNSGMLHGFNANTGVEVFAFIPNSVILGGLKDIADPEYDHKYLLDGEITVADVYMGSSGGWRTILVGTQGRGGRSIYALDITDPANISFLWERNATNIPALGNNLGSPIIAQISNGEWRVLLGNGPNGANNRAQLIMITLSSGNSNGNVKVIDTNVTGSLGMSGIRTWDSNNNGFIDTVYAGDFIGNIYRISDLSANTPTVNAFFQALDGDGQPQVITAAPTTRKDEQGATWVFFGTGQYLHQDDLLDMQTQTWYGLRDMGLPIAGKAALTERSITQEAVLHNRDVRVISATTQGDMVGKSGWYMDLLSPNNGAEGERMVIANSFRGNVLVGTTRIPDSSDPCAPTGRGYVMAIDPFTGARLNFSFFDLNADGLFNEDDMLDGVPISGIGFDRAPNAPVFMDNVMQVNLEDGTIESITTQSGSNFSERTSWRELINPAN